MGKQENSATRTVIIIFVVLIGGVLIATQLLRSGSNSRSNGPTQTIAEIEVERIFDNKSLILDQSQMEDIMDYMDKEVSNSGRGRGEERYFDFRYVDGSVIRFVMVPASAGGLVLQRIENR
jgi:hypothetical protein